MAQFDIYRNANESTASLIPYLIDAQHEFHESLGTRLVIPLIRDMRQVEGLYLPFEIEGEVLYAAVPEMGSVLLETLGERTGTLSERSSELINAIDFLVTGF